AGPLVDTLDRHAYYKLLMDPQTVSRVLHIWLASLAVAGAVVMLRCIQMAKRQDMPVEVAARVAAGGARIALSATLLQLPIGAWVLLELPNSSRDQLMG